MNEQCEQYDDYEDTGQPMTRAGLLWLVGLALAGWGAAALVVWAGVALAGAAK